MLANYINPAVPQLKVGQLVAYDYLYNSKTWQWTLGTVRDLGEYTATVQQWGLHTGNVDTLRSILSREVDGEAARMRNYQDALSIARETLASIRRSNEDRVSAVREHFDKARTALEVVDEVDLRKVTSQAAPSPVAVAVLKAAWSVAKCDPTAVEFFEWADVQLEYRKSNALDNVAKTDVVAKLYPSPETLVRALEQDPKLSYKAAARDSPVVASLHAWVTTALAYQQAYSNLNHDKRIQEQNDAIAAAIAGMKASRAKIATLKDELAAKNASAHPGQVTSFTRTSVLVSIPLSAVICPVNIDSKVEDCVLTNDEVAQILVDAKAMRFQQKEKLNVVVSRLLEQYATATTTGAYAKELEERLFFLQHCYGGILRDAQVAANEDKEQVDDLVRELAAHRLKRFDAKQARANDPDLSGVDDAVQPSSRARSRWRAPESPIEARNGKARRTDSRERDAAAVQPVSPAVIAHEPLFIATADELRKLRDEADKLARKVADQEGKIQKLDKELARSNCNCKDSLSRLQTALDELEGSKEACDKLAAENDKLHRDLEVLQRAAEELDSLKDKLATKDAELAAHRQKRLDAKSARIKDPAFAAADGAGRRSPVSTSRRRAPGSTKDDVGSNRSGAAKQELESALTPVDPVVIKREPLYAVTMDEYKALAAEIAREKEGRSALALENDVLAGELERLQGELQAAQESIADKQRANEAAARALDELAAKDAELAAFRQKRQDAKRARAGEPELVAADDARAHGDADARSDRASIRSTASRSSRGRIGGTRSTARGDSIDAASTPVDPVVIAQEPLYAVTLDEYKAKDAAGNSAVEEAEKLAEELQKEKSEAERLADDLEKAKARSDRVAKKLAAKEDELAQANLELAAFRRKRVEAKKARAAEPELAAANASISTGGVGNADTQSDHGSAPSSSNRSSPRGPTATTRTGAREHPHDVASESVDPAVIAREPLYAVTVEEYSAKHAAGEAATAEAERLADELEAAKGEAEHLATELAAKDAELAAKDAELAAFRQKRQDAKDARANDPELAAADAAASRGKSATSDEGAAADRGAGVGSGADAASRAVDPAVIAEEPLYVATAGEVQQLRDDLECRTRALADTEAELDGLRTAVVDKQAECADYADKLDGALGELEKKRQEIDALAEAKSMLEKDLAAQVENNHDLNAENDALKKELDDLDRENKKLADSFANAEDEKHRLCDDLEAALDELEQKKDDYDQLLGNLEQVEGLLEASKAAGRSAVDALEHRNEEMADLQAELAEALRACKENDVLRAQLEEKDREIADLMRHSELWRDPAPAEDAGKAKVTHRFTKIFDGDWTKLIQQRPEALMAAFVIDSSNACHVPGDQINQVAFDHD